MGSPLSLRDAEHEPASESCAREGASAYKTREAVSWGANHASLFALASLRPAPRTQTRSPPRPPPSAPCRRHHRPGNECAIGKRATRGTAAVNPARTLTAASKRGQRTRKNGGRHHVRSRALSMQRVCVLGTCSRGLCLLSAGLPLFPVGHSVDGRTKCLRSISAKRDWEKGSIVLTCGDNGRWRRRWTGMENNGAPQTLSGATHSVCRQVEAPVFTCRT